jgi:cytochrome c553
MLVFVGLTWPTVAAGEFEDAVKPFLEKYCAVCHNRQANAGKFDVTPMLKRSEEEAVKQKQQWNLIYEKVSSGQMPKKGALLPSPQLTTQVLAWIDRMVAP